VPLLELLLQNGARAAWADAAGRQPLHYAVLAGRTEAAKLLVGALDAPLAHHMHFPPAPARPGWLAPLSRNGAVPACACACALQDAWQDSQRWIPVAHIDRGTRDCAVGGFCATSQLRVVGEPLLQLRLTPFVPSQVRRGAPRFTRDVTGRSPLDVLLEQPAVADRELLFWLSETEQTRGATGER